MNRREFHRLTATAGLSLANVSDAAPTGAPRRRPPFRLLYSNDTTNITGCVSPYHQARQPLRQEMIEASVDETVSAGVDAHFLQPGLGMVPMWPSTVLPLEEHYRWLKERYGQQPDTFGRFVMAGGDVVKTFIDRCRHHGQSAFISLRMNDAHHKEFADTPKGQKPGANLAMSVTRFYDEHPEWRIKRGSKRGADTVLNWAVPEVRAQKLALIEELASNYDLDGFELDFMRFNSLFRPEETTATERAAIQTQFVTLVRQILDRTARAGRRVWLCLRIPCLHKGLDPLGLNLPALYAAGADMFTLSASYYTVQQTDLPTLRKQVPEAALYLELCHTTWTGKKLSEGYDVFPFRRTTREQFQTAAHLAYARGADGVSLFNFAYYREHGGPGRGPFSEPPFDVLPSLRQPNTLAELPQHWFQGPGWNNPYIRPPLLPRELILMRRTGFAWDLAPPREGWPQEGRLRLQFESLPPGFQAQVRLNGIVLEPSEDVSEPFPNPYPPLLGMPHQLRAWRVPGKLLKDGINMIDITQKEGAKTRLTFLDLALK